MQNVIQFARHVDKLRDVVVVKLKIRVRHQVFDVPHIARDEVIHRDHVMSFFNKSVAKVRT